jgi:iron complex transport system substrate-binding protein
MAGLVLAATIALSGCGDDAAGGQDAAEETRTIEHAMGSTEVRGQPERVVVLDTGELDSAIALGVAPVGAVEAIAGAGFPDYLAERAQSVEPVGTIEQPSLEAIAALQPDLILSSKLRHEAIYDQLSRIAPTVFTEQTGVDWRENFLVHADALGRAEEAERLTGEYRAAIADFREAMGPERERTRVSVVRSVGDEVRVYLTDNFIGTGLEDLGLPRPEAQDVDDFSLTATLENIEALDGDVMFLSRYGSEHRLLERLMGSPLWDRLGAVREGHVREVPDDLWFLGLGNLAARLVIDDLTTILVEGRELAAEPAGASAG